MGILQKLFDNNERDVKRYRKMVEKVNALEEQYKALTDDELRAKTDELRQRFNEGIQQADGDALEAREKAAPRNTRERKLFRETLDKVLDDLLPDAFAACRQAAQRTLGMRHFDVQLIGGMVQHDGRISELRTGEGKTLTCTLAAYLNALAGRGVHIVTANDYLVKRDAVWMGPLFHALGLTVGILQGHSPETGEGGGTFIYDPTYEEPSVDGLDARYKYSRPTSNRQEAYQCDITYGTSSEFGFDYLRDNMVNPWMGQQIVQVREHHFAIVDECDSNLIDEARTPLIISGPADKPSENYYLFDRLIPALVRGEQKKDKYDTTTDEKDYTVDEKAKSASFTEDGLDKVEQSLRTLGYPVEDISSDREAMQYATAALKAHAVFIKDKDYVVRPNQEGKPEVVIVDENTGRLMFGRRWSDGLHQAIEAKEGIEIENEQQTMATITIQNYFRLYRKLAGMTGTAKTEEDEFRKIYALDVVQVPTNKPNSRKDIADIIYKSEESKLRGIAAEILTIHCRQQPILVGTRSIDMSERVSARLTFQALEVLGAILLLRQALEEQRKALGEKYTAASQLLNSRLDDLNPIKLRPVAQQVGVKIDFANDETALAKLAEYLGVDADGLPALKDALTYGIPHNVLNAKYHEQEARIIAEAGRKGAITIATNMAGRGVDILLGGTHYKEISEDAIAKADFSYKRGGKRQAFSPTANRVAHVVDGRDQADSPDTSGPAGAGTLTEEEALSDADYAREREEVRARGGLYILGTERHESRRIDNQLRGRSGRQGDPGTSRFHVSLEDYLWRVFGDRSNSMLMKGWEEDQAVDMRFLSPLIERAQKKVEQHNFDGRKHVLEYDDVMNVQRERIYSDRRAVLEGADLKETMLSSLHDLVDNALALYCPGNIMEEEWDRSGLWESLNQQIPLASVMEEDAIRELRRAELADALHDGADQVYQAREDEVGAEVMRDMERYFTLREIDQAWVHHLADMDYLREGIGLRGYAQVDPLVAYKKEALELFEQMQGGVKGGVLANVLAARVEDDQGQAVDYGDMSQFGDLGELGELDLQALMEQMGAQFGGALAPPQFDENAEYEDGQPVLAGRAPMPSSMIPDVGQSALLAAMASSAEEKQAQGQKVGPDDACPCGSGKKYKQCHRNRPLP